MKEQIQLPFDSRGESETETKSKKVSINRPLLPKGLEKPKTPVASNVLARFQRCDSCSDPDCNVPAQEGSVARWAYYDSDNIRLWDVEPYHGPRFLPGR